MLVLIADNTGSNVVLDVLFHGWPPECLPEQGTGRLDHRIVKQDVKNDPIPTPPLSGQVNIQRAS